LHSARADGGYHRGSLSGKRLERSRRVGSGGFMPNVERFYQSVFLIDPQYLCNICCAMSEDADIRADALPQKAEDNGL
jgi:hypothetical protein